MPNLPTRLHRGARRFSKLGQYKVPNPDQIGDTSARSTVCSLGVVSFGRPPAAAADVLQWLARAILATDCFQSSWGGARAGMPAASISLSVP
eukprot:2086959-Prymnesium_polylepis.2